MEIERKYLIKHVPNNLHDYEMKTIEQGYICSNPIVRIRRMNDDYFLTYKSKIKNTETTAIVNNEIEMELTREAYEHLKKKIDNYLIEKKRYLIPIDSGLTIELDIFEGRLAGLYFAEIEFPDLITAEHVILPEWIESDISDDNRYGNYYLSKLNSKDELSIRSQW